MSLPRGNPAVQRLWRQRCVVATLRRGILVAAVPVGLAGAVACPDVALIARISGAADAGRDAATTCAPEGPRGGTSCDDGLDNDCDGQTDGADVGCQELCADSEWCLVAPRPWLWNSALWVAGPSRVWIFNDNAGPGGLDAALFDGGGWRVMATGMGNAARVVWGAAEDDIWVGSSGEVSHWDGNHWTPHRLEENFWITGLWGAAADDIWAVGTSRGTMWRWRGQGWQREATGVDQSLGLVWGSSAADVWTWSADSIYASNDITLRRWNGSAFVEVQQVVASQIRAALALAPDAAWVSTSGTVLYWDGSHWGMTSIDGSSWDTTHMERWRGVAGIWGAAPDRLWAVGNKLTAGLSTSIGFAARWDGAAWSEQALPVSAELGAVHGRAGGDAWALASGALLRDSGAGWEVEAQQLGVEAQGLYAIWGSGDADIWAVGVGGRATHYDGLTWREATTPTEKVLLAVFGFAPDAFWASGTGGTLLRWDGAAWQTETSPTPDGIIDLWGLDAEQLWALEEQGAVLRRQAGQWQIESRLPGGRPKALWGGAADDLWVAGDDSRTWRWDGAAWTEHLAPSLIGLPIHDLMADAAGQLWAAGSFGHVFRWDGSAWQIELKTDYDDLQALWAGVAGEVIVAPPFWELQDGAWLQQSAPVRAGVEGLWQGPGGTTWAVGMHGAILRRGPQR